MTTDRSTFYHPTYTLPTNPPITSTFYPPLSPATSTTLVVLLPPYPPLGGTRHDPLLALISQALRRPPYNALCLTLDYPGKLSWTGSKEIAAVHSAIQAGIDVLQESAGGGVDDGVEVVVVGYSYGGLVASHVKALREVEGVRAKLFPLPVLLEGNALWQLTRSKVA
ncbi:hypothetical protein BJ508DRAFT_380194 [Ascobolus immersus RN42]|uniref:PE-PPE domain-containing protein n=1 Tax=Ascobolus immersus RN42 TaxID=1160509 RepID=A0A3N4HN03_ASCIM|nr:hypothetical protein BJ508DRAFT_380194 [Ascobolus immersus RN42]